MTSVNTPRPVQEFRARGTLIKVAVWRREFEDGAFYTYGPERSYKDKHGDWKRTSSFTPQEWIVVQELLAKAQSYVETALAKEVEADVPAA